MTQPTERCYHALQSDEVLGLLDVGRTGLKSIEAANRLAKYGPNRLPEPARHNVILRFLRQFHNVF